jgi:hypothetical protein
LTAVFSATLDLSGAAVEKLTAFKSAMQHPSFGIQGIAALSKR